METALDRVLDDGGRPVTWSAPNASIRLAEGDGPLLDGAVITAWPA